MWHHIFMALALVLVVEGILPFLNPTRWRRFLSRVSELPDRILRITGFSSMIVGAILLHYFH